MQRREGDGPAEGEPIVGVEHDAGRVSVVNYLAAAVIGLALLGVAPAIWEIVDHLGNEDSPGVAVWALGLLAIAGLQVAYAVFLMQIPDWSSVRVVALVLLAYAAGYALMLGVSAISSTGNGLVGFLQLAEYHDDGRAAGWCFIMLCSTSLLTFFAGRLAVRWKADDDEFEATLEEAP